MSLWRHTVTRAAGAIAIALAAVGTLAFPVAASAHTARAPDLGTFAGYEAGPTHVRSVHASWIVPRLSRGVSPGDQSSIWIGTRGAGSQLRAPFIQVGVIVADGVLGGETVTAFWSDTVQGFLPRTLGVAVRPGDRLRASMTLVDGRWHLVLDDLSRRRVGRLTTTQEGRSRFNAAQWIEEDPSSQTPGGQPRGVPFARTSTVRIAALRCDGVPPSRRSLYSLWMSLPHVVLAPTPVVGDSFAVVPTRLAPAAARYIALVTPENAAAAALDARLDPWLDGGSSTAIVPAARRLIRSLRAVAAGLDASGWPPSSDAARAALVADDQRLSARLAQIPALAPPARAGWNRSWGALSRRTSSQGQAMRNALGAPDITPSARAIAAKIAPKAALSASWGPSARSAIAG